MLERFYPRSVVTPKILRRMGELRENPEQHGLVVLPEGVRIATIVTYRDNNKKQQTLSLGVLELQSPITVQYDMDLYTFPRRIQFTPGSNELLRLLRGQDLSPEEDNDRWRYIEQEQQRLAQLVVYDEPFLAMVNAHALDIRRIEQIVFTAPLLGRRGMFERVDDKINPVT